MACVTSSSGLLNRVGGGGQGLLQFQFHVRSCVYTVTRLFYRHLLKITDSLVVTTPARVDIVSCDI